MICNCPHSVNQHLPCSCFEPMDAAQIRRAKFAHTIPYNHVPADDPGKILIDTLDNELNPDG